MDSVASPRPTPRTASVPLGQRALASRADATAALMCSGDGGGRGHTPQEGDYTIQTCALLLVRGMVNRRNLQVRVAFDG